MNQVEAELVGGPSDGKRWWVPEANPPIEIEVQGSPVACGDHVHPGHTACYRRREQPVMNPRPGGPVWMYDLAAPDPAGPMAR